MQTIDFSRSYLRFRLDPSRQPAITVTRPMPTSVLNVRINLDCRCELFNRTTEETDEFVLCAPCKTELVGADRDIWMEPNADFRVVASTDEFMVLKSWARNNMPISKHPDMLGIPLERQSGLCRDAWTDHGYEVCAISGNQVRTFDEIMGAIRSARPIAARICYDDGPWRVTIDHPVKTINYSELDDVYQTDTGPILLPDLSPERLARGNRLIDCFDLAYEAFNSDNWAEFIINVPTQIGDQISVNHYSKTRRIEPTSNSLVEVVEESQPAGWHVGAERGSRVGAAGPHNGGNGFTRRSQLFREKQ
ncbi:MAG: hypothetical protein WD468_08055 [Pirellulales bacterium]